MDSIALSFWLKPRFAFTINYGQRSALAEIQAAQQVSKILNMEHHVIEVDCSSLGSGDMASEEPLDIAPVTEWWPYRNQLLVTLACMKGIALGMSELLVGSVKNDSVHCDGNKEFYDHLSKVVAYQEGGVKIKVPAINLSTPELIKASKVPKSILLWAHSCHTSNEPCMHCNGCYKYLATLQELGFE